MADRALRESLTQSVEDRLVGDFTGEADVAWRKGRGRTAHQQLAPMRGRSGNMRDGFCVEASDVIGKGFARLRQHQRSAADDRAQKNLQAAITAGVVTR